MSQSAQVGSLIVIILTFLTTFGPRVGTAVAQFMICQLQPAPMCTEPVPVGAVPGTPADPPTVAQPDSTVDLAVPDCAASQAQVETLFPGGVWDSAALDGLGATAATGLQATPGEPSSGTWSMNGCTLSINADRGTELTNSWTSLWHNIVAGLVGAASAAVAYVACGATAASLFPPIGPFCGALAGFTIGFVWNLVGPALNGQSIGGTEVLSAFLAGLIAAVPAGFAYALDGISAAIPAVLRSMAEAISSGLGRAWGWVQRAAGAAVGQLTTWLENAAEYVAAAVATDPAIPQTS